MLGCTCRLANPVKALATLVQSERYSHADTQMPRTALCRWLTETHRNVLKRIRTTADSDSLHNSTPRRSAGDALHQNKVTDPFSGEDTQQFGISRKNVNVARTDSLKIKTNRGPLTTSTRLGLETVTRQAQCNVYPQASLAQSQWYVGGHVLS